MGEGVAEFVAYARDVQAMGARNREMLAEIDRWRGSLRLLQEEKLKALPLEEEEIFALQTMQDELQQFQEKLLQQQKMMAKFMRKLAAEVALKYQQNRVSDEILASNPNNEMFKRRKSS